MPNGQVLVVDLMDLMLLFLCIVWSETVILSFSLHLSYSCSRVACAIPYYLVNKDEFITRLLSAHFYTSERPPIKYHRLSRSLYSILPLRIFPRPSSNIYKGQKV